MELVVRGRSIKTTAEHPFFVPAQSRFVPAGELKAGDQLVSSSGELMSIDSVSPLSELTTVYNLRIADFHTYFVGGKLWQFDAWVHNAGQIDYVGSANAPVSAADKAFESLAQLRRELGVPAAEIDDAFTLSRLDIDGHSFFGINGGVANANEAARTLQQLAAELGHKGPTFQLLRHAEGDALLQAFNRGIGQGKNGNRSRLGLID